MGEQGNRAAESEKRALAGLPKNVRKGRERAAAGLPARPEVLSAAPASRERGWEIGEDARDGVLRALVDVVENGSHSSRDRTRAAEALMRAAELELARRRHESGADRGSQPGALFSLDASGYAALVDALKRRHAKKC